MAFESLADKLQNVFKNLTGKGRLSESDVNSRAQRSQDGLLEADVSFKVVKQFISSVQERANWNRRFKWSESRTDGNKDCQRRGCVKADGLRR